MTELLSTIAQTYISSSVQFSHSFVSNSLRPHGLQHTRPPCPSPDPGACSSSCLSSGGCHPTISSSVLSFSCLQSFPASESFPVSQFFTSGGQSIKTSVSASFFPMNIQDWFTLGSTGLILKLSLHRKSSQKAIYDPQKVMKLSFKNYIHPPKKCSSFFGFRYLITAQYSFWASQLLSR